MLCKPGKISVGMKVSILSRKQLSVKFESQDEYSGLKSFKKSSLIQKCGTTIVAEKVKKQTILAFCKETGVGNSFGLSKCRDRQ